MVCYETVCDVTHLEWLFRVYLAQSRYVFNLYLDFREKCYETVTLFVYVFYDLLYTGNLSPSPIGLGQATMFRLILSYRLPTLVRRIRLTPDYIG